MNLSHAYGAPVSAEQGERVLLAALDAGVTLFDTAALYGFGANETLVGRVLKQHRSRFTLASKCGMQGVDVNGDGKLVRVIDGRPATLRQTCEDSLRRLQTDVIDLYYLHRWDKSVPIEDSVGALADLVRAGKIRSIGLSEVSAATLRRAVTSLPQGSWTLERTTIAGRWMVYMGRFADTDVLAKKRAELREMNVPYDRPASASLEPGLSLGRFSTEEAAQRGLSNLTAKGVRTARVVQERTDAPGYMLRLPAADSALRAKVEALRAPMAGKALRPCN